MIGVSVAGIGRPTSRKRDRSDGAVERCWVDSWGRWRGRPRSDATRTAGRRPVSSTVWRIESSGGCPSSVMTRSTIAGRRSGRVMNMILTVGLTPLQLTRCQAGRHVVPAPPEDDHGSKIPSGRRIGCFVWSTARCVAILRIYPGRKPHLLTDFPSG